MAFSKYVAKKKKNEYGYPQLFLDFWVCNKQSTYENFFQNFMRILTCTLYYIRAKQTEVLVM